MPTKDYRREKRTEMAGVLYKTIVGLLTIQRRRYTVVVEEKGGHPNGDTGKPWHDGLDEWKSIRPESEHILANGSKL